jgi:hypothetical protein
MGIQGPADPSPTDLSEPVPYHGYSWPWLEQKPEEFTWWLQLLLTHNVNRLPTIGSMHSGVEWHISRVFSEQNRRIDITAVDLCDRQELREAFDDAHTRFGQSLDPIVGDSGSAQTRQQLAKNYDAVFIDGDHSYFACRKNFLLAKSLCPRLIGVHDIVDSDWHADARCCVSRLWGEIVQEHQTEEHASREWGGIGVVKL